MTIAGGGPRACHECHVLRLNRSSISGTKISETSPKSSSAAMAAIWSPSFKSRSCKRFLVQDTHWSDMPWDITCHHKMKDPLNKIPSNYTVIHSRKTGMDLRSHTKHQKTETHSHSLNSERVFWPLRMYQLQHAAMKGLVYMSETIDGWKWPGEFCTPAVMLPNMIYVQSTCRKE